MSIDDDHHDDDEDLLKVKQYILHDQDINKVVLDSYLQRINFKPHFHSSVVNSNNYNFKY
jgi:hypothetical protein